MIFRGVQTIPNGKKIDCGPIAKVEFHRHYPFAEFLHSLGRMLTFGRIELFTAERHRSWLVAAIRLAVKISPVKAVSHHRAVFRLLAIRAGTTSVA